MVGSMFGLTHAATVTLPASSNATCTDNALQKSVHLPPETMGSPHHALAPFWELCLWFRRHLLTRYSRRA